MPAAELSCAAGGAALRPAPGEGTGAGRAAPRRCGGRARSRSPPAALRDSCPSLSPFMKPTLSPSSYADPHIGSPGRARGQGSDVSRPQGRAAPPEHADSECGTPQHKRWSSLSAIYYPAVTDTAARNQPLPWVPPAELPRGIHCRSGSNVFAVDITEYKTSQPFGTPEQGVRRAITTNGSAQEPGRPSRALCAPYTPPFDGLPSRLPPPPALPRSRSAARPAGSRGQQRHLLQPRAAGPPAGAEQEAGQRAQLLAQHAARLVALRGEKRGE